MKCFLTHELTLQDPVLALTIMDDASSTLFCLAPLKIPVSFQEMDGLLDLQEMALN